MARQPKQKKIKKFTSRMQAKLMLVFCVLLMVMVALIVRLIYINNKDGERYEKRVLSQQSYVSSTIPYKRGSILDRNGVVLAASTKVYNVILDPKIILTDEDYLEPTVKALNEVFGLDVNYLYSLINEKSTSSYYRLLKKQEYDLVSQFEALQKADKSKNIKGVWFEEEYFRSYPYGSLASHVIGYTSAGDVGTWGIEQYYNTNLNGTNGRTYGYYDSELNLTRTTKAAVNGNTIISTIDVNAQRIVEEHIKKFNETIGCENIGVILMDPNNGEIIAMASNEGFDLNDPFELSGFYSTDEINAMSEDEKLNVRNKIWRNFCISDTFEPGSTFKPLTVAAALEEDLVTPEDTFLCTGSVAVGGWIIHCNNKSGHGHVTLAESLMKSCNPALMAIGEREGSSLFLRYQQHFGLGKKSGIDLPGEAEGILQSAQNLNVTELATSSFGQTFNVTMVQMAAAYSSLVNGGYYYQPHVVREIVDDQGATVESMDDLLIRETVSASTSDFIKEATYLTVEEGTAKPAKVEGYKVGGKTGTAQKFPRSAKKYVVSFIGSVPADNPQLVIYVVIDEIHDEEKKASSTVATTLTSEILSDVLKFLEIYPDGDIDYKVDLPVNDHVTVDDLENGDGSTAVEDGTHIYDPSQDEKTPDAIPDTAGTTFNNSSTENNATDDSTGGATTGNTTQGNTSP